MRFSENSHALRFILTTWLLGTLLGLSGCQSESAGLSNAAPTDSTELGSGAEANATKTESGPRLDMGTIPMPTHPSDIQFKDHVATNVAVPQGMDQLVFLDTSGDRVALGHYLGKKNVVLVFTKGFAGGMLCPFCTTQTSRLVANYDKFKQLDTEVLVVYPGARDHLDEFIAAAKKTEKHQVDQVPFPLLLDEELVAAEFFSIKSNLARPSTFIIDKQGNVRLAYVGADMTADRPSIAAMLGVLAEENTP